MGNKDASNSVGMGYDGGMSKEAFRRKWLGELDHKQLQISEHLAKGRKSLMKDDANRYVKRTTRGKLILKPEYVVKSKTPEDRFKELLFDVVNSRIKDISEADITKILGIVAGFIPRKIESKNETAFTFADMVKQVTLENKEKSISFSKVDTIDAVTESIEEKEEQLDD